MTPEITARREEQHRRMLYAMRVEGDILRSTRRAEYTFAAVILALFLIVVLL